MPELPEVETTRRGIAPYVTGRQVTRVIVRNPNLRWKVPARINSEMSGQTINEVSRRGKYLLLTSTAGSAILHLGMSGSLRLVEAGTPPGKHDHVDIEFAGKQLLRFTDPRRFGSLHWTRRPPLQHKLLCKLGVEPLSDEYNGDYLHRISRGRTVAIKQFIMNSHIVTGIGNIYACEALFMAGIYPGRATGRISKKKYGLLAEVCKEVLNDAIAAGGTTLRDFVNGHGEPGWFKQELHVYGLAGRPCISCRTAIREMRQGQRATFYCPVCQKRVK